MKHIADSGRYSAGPPPESTTTTPSRPPAPRPEDIGLPRANSSFALPALIALAVFTLIIGARLLWQW
jgi:hypothetical protein